MTLAALQGLHVVVCLSFVARRSTCFFATISETSDEDKNPIWLCPYWATASLLTMLSVAHIFSSLPNQCGRSFSVLLFGQWHLQPCRVFSVVVSLMSNCKTAAFNCSDIVVVVLVSPTRSTVFFFFHALYLYINLEILHDQKRFFSQHIFSTCHPIYILVVSRGILNRHHIYPMLHCLCMTHYNDIQWICGITCVCII